MVWIDLIMIYKKKGYKSILVVNEAVEKYAFFFAVLA